MKLGCCTNMIGTPPDSLGAQYIPLLPLCGYDYIELSVADLMRLDDQGFAFLQNTLQQNGVCCIRCNNFLPAGLKITGPQANPQQLDVYLSAAFARMKRLGVQMVGLGSPGARNVPEGFSHQQAQKQLLQAVQMMEQYARQNGMLLLLEPLNHTECNIMQTIGQALHLMQAAGSDNIKLVVDYYHFRMQNETLATLRSAKDQVYHLHFGMPPQRTYPAERLEEYRAFLDVFGERLDTLCMSVEAFSQSPAEDIARFVKVFAPYQSAKNL